jgi:hypothetical protein
MFEDPAPLVDSRKATQLWKLPEAPYDLLTTGAGLGVYLTTGAE